jgi:hypothetical protein
MSETNDIPDSPSNATDLLLRSSPERDQAFEIHPIVTDKAKIPTPAVKDAFEVISSAIVHRDPGVCFVADSRFGKTFAIDVLQETLPQSFPLIPMYSVVAKGHDRPTERSLYTDLLMDCHHGGADIGTAIARRIRLLNLWLATVQASGGDRLILFVDEAQNWAEEDFTRVRDISNDLALNKFRLITLLFAHPNLLATRISLLAVKRTDLIGRFMLHPRVFRGVSSLSDLIEVMKCYDDPKVSEFPMASGISYSQFFRPQAFHAGWRLEKEAGSCWAAFSTEAAKHGGHYQVGMQWVAGAIRNFLYVHWQLEHGEPAAGSGNLWTEAVRASGFEFSLGVTQDPM